MEFSIDRLLGFYILLVLILALASAGYARFLKSIHHIYSPDHVDKTVIGGVALIHFAEAIAVILGLTTWLAWFVHAGLTLAAGIPILLWQREERHKRAEERKAARNRGRRDE